MTVPQLPGVPTLPQGVGVTPQPTEQLTSDDPSAYAQTDPIVWGIYDQDGNPVITGDSVKAIDFHNDYRISDFPVEQGGFASYNKVATPFDLLVTFVQSGSITDRQDFLNQLQTSLSSLDLYQVITPEIQYLDVNVCRILYRRTHKEGVQMLTVDVYCREVRESGTLQFSTTATPDGASQQNDGTVQPKTPSSQTSTPATDENPAQISFPLPDNAVINPDNGQFFANPQPTNTVNLYGPLPVDGNPDELPPGTPVM